MKYWIKRLWRLFFKRKSYRQVVMDLHPVAMYLWDEEL